MPLYALTARDKPNGLDQRMAIRPRHLAHLESMGEQVVLAGPFQDEDGKATGSIVIIEARDIEDARALFARDPYILEGLFQSYEISRWAFVVNKAAGR